MILKQKRIVLLVTLEKEITQVKAKELKVNKFLTAKHNALNIIHELINMRKMGQVNLK